jgi:hypothetical protein
VRVHARAWMLVCGTPHHHRRFAWIPLIDWANPDNSSFFSANALAMQADDGATLCVAQHPPFATSRSLCERFIHLPLTVCVVDASHMFSHVHSCLSFPFTLVCCISILLLLSSCLAHFRFSSRYFATSSHFATFSLLSSCSTPLSFTRATSSPARYKLK